VYSGSARKCLRFFFCMNGYHSGLLRVYVRVGGGPRQVCWQMHGDQGPDWRSADIELNMTSVTEVPTTRRHSLSLTLYSLSVFASVSLSLSLSLSLIMKLVLAYA